MEVTTLAIEKLKEVMEEQGEANGSLRVVAIPAEAGGLQYMLTMENESQSDDTVMSMEGVEFLMDSDSAPFLEEATIDYVENLGGQVGFVINNPMFSSAGGCGEGCGCGSGGGGGCGGGGGGGNQMPEPPRSSIANAGRTNSPEPNIAESEMMTTETIPSFRSSVSLTNSMGL